MVEQVVYKACRHRWRSEYVCLINAWIENIKAWTKIRSWSTKIWMINNIKNGEIIKTNNKNTELIALSCIIKIF